MSALPFRLPEWGSVFGYVFDQDEPPRLQPATLHCLDEAHLDAVTALHHAATADLPHGFVREDDASFFRSVLATGGKLLGVSVNGRLVAYAVLTLAAEGRQHYGALIGLPEQDWNGIACLDGVAVHPAWRGNALQRHLTSWRIALAWSLGRRHVCATTAPANDASWGTLLKVGLRIKAVGRFYGGLARYVAHIDRERPAPVTPEPASGVCVAVNNLEHAAELLSNGHVGWRRWKPNRERTYLVVGRL